MKELKIWRLLFANLRGIRIESRVGKAGLQGNAEQRGLDLGAKGANQALGRELTASRT